jgi:hypothetical protein
MADEHAYAVAGQRTGPDFYRVMLGHYEQLNTERVWKSLEWLHKWKKKREKEMLQADGRAERL